MTISVVVPVHDGAALVEGCVRSMLGEVESLGGEVVVVDDASRDSSAEVASRAGATVVALATASGPYAARNAGWRAARHDVVAFVDVRCRAAGGWAGSVLAAFGDDDVAVVGGDVSVAHGATLAARTAVELQPLRLQRPDEVTFLPFAPTCNLVVRRRALEAAGGFAPVRGGGDVDLCWWIQHEGVGTFRAEPAAQLRWTPRPTMRGLLEQLHRYGFNHGRVARAWSDAGCPVPVGHGPVRTALHAVRSHERPWRSTTWAAGAARAAYDVGLAAGMDTVDPALGPGGRG